MAMFSHDHAIRGTSPAAGSSLLVPEGHFASRFRMGVRILDINSLLAKEQISLLRARFEPAAGARDEYLKIAAEQATSLRLTHYPYRQLAFEMLI